MRPISVRGTIAGREAEAVWRNGQVSAQPPEVLLLAQMYLGREVDVPGCGRCAASFKTPQGFVAAMLCAFDEAHLGDGALLELAPEARAPAPAPPAAPT